MSYDASMDFGPSMTFEPSATVLEVEHALREHFASSDDRLNHSISAAQMAILLAQLYGVDVQNAAIAGLLHDWDKNLPVEELRARALMLSLPLSPRDIESGHYDEVLHAPVGADTVFGLFPDLDPSVYSAIAKHTVASNRMNELESVIYIADMIEPLRNTRRTSRSAHDQATYVQRLDTLREAVGTVSLEQLLFQCYRHSTLHLVEQARSLYPTTANVYNTLLTGEVSEANASDDAMVGGVRG